MKKKNILWTIAIVLPCLITLFIACVKDLEEEDIYTETKIIGTVVEKSTMQPIKGVIVSVTDGTHIHASTTTNSQGAFSLKDIDYEACKQDYYLWLDGTPLDLPTKQEALKGVGREVYDYKALALYDKTDVDLLPRVTTGDITDTMALSAKGAGSVTYEGEHTVSERGVCVSEHQAPTMKDSVYSSGGGLGDYTCAITGLKKSTTYYVRAYAINSIDTVYGGQRTFKTKNGNPSVTTSAATDIKYNGATLPGSITNDGGAEITQRGFCYGTTTNPTLSNSVTSDGTGTGTFSHTLQNLQGSTKYYYRAYAINACCTTYGTQRNFTTTSGLPTLTTSAVSNITASTAKCGGEITDNGGFNVTTRGVCWNTTGNPTTSDNKKASGSGNGTFTCDITNLSPGVTYHIRAYATNSKGTSYGEEKTFTTSNGSVSMTLSAATNITATSASFNVNITNDGGASITARGICWSTSQSPTVSGSHAASGTGTGSFSASATSLSPATTYYVRAYATNAAGTSYSSQISFTTNSGMPQVTTGSVSNVTATTAVCSGNVTSDGGFTVTKKGFCWGTAQYPTISGTHSNEGSGTGSFNGSLTNLSVGTTFYVRAYATNSTGTAYGEQVSFTTGNGLPTVTTTTPTLSGNTVATGGNVTSDGGFPVTARGICYGQFPYPDLTSTYNHTTNGSGTGYYSSSFSLPLGSGIYYVRAYATNANGTSYGEQAIAVHPYDTLPTFTHNGHTYKVAPMSPNTMNWNAANLWCNNQTFMGFSDWRLPTRDELLQMFIAGVISSGNYSGNYWSSTTCSGGHIYVSGPASYGCTGYTEYAIPIRMEN